MLNPTPTEAHITELQDIALLTSFSDTAFYVNRLNQAQWTATLEDLTEWAKVKNKHTVIKGGGVEIDKSRNRLDITNRVRRRFGLQGVDENGVVASPYDYDEDGGTTSIEVHGAW